MPPSSGPPPGRDHWSRLRPQLEALLELEGDAREAALGERFSGPGERELVRSLLAEADSEEADALSVPLVDVDAAHLPTQDHVGASGLLTNSEPERVGPWELRRRIGAGGMGEVWFAVRADGQFTQRAALKRIRSEMDGAEVVARFERERQVLASLDHPGIARLLDGGVDDGGRPYLVMEFIDGVPIDRWCDERRLDVRARVRLLIDVARAVDAAHGLQVVHRDLKPSNVLVDQTERPRLIDFGVAKVLDPEKDAASHVTRDITRYVTPAYASPEQLTAERVSPASDVYSLGALAYALLTGRTPLDVAGRPPAEMMRMLIEDKPAPMSAAVGRSSTPGLADALRGDLETVIGACLCKEPARRYARAGDLANDLQRWLDGKAVKAHPDSLLYRARRFVQRNRALVAVTALAFLTLAVGLVVVLSQQRQLRASRDALASSSSEVEALLDDLRDSVVAMMTRHYLELSAIPGTERVLGRMVRATAAVAERQGDPVLLVESIRAQSLIAASLWSPYRDATADPVRALSAHERARASALKVAALHSTDPITLITIGETRNGALVAMSQAGRFDEALAESIELAAWVREHVIYVPQSKEEIVPEGDPEVLGGMLLALAQAQLSRSILLRRLGRLGEAEEVVAAALVELVGDTPDSTLGLMMSARIAGLYQQQAALFRETGQLEQARTSIDRASALLARAADGHIPAVPINDQYASNLVAETALARSEGRADASWIALLDSSAKPGSGSDSTNGLSAAGSAEDSAAERTAWRRLSSVSRARLNCAAAQVEMEENRPAAAARHGRLAVEILEELLTGRERVWIESRLLRSFWLVRGQAHAQNGELLEASRFLGLALSHAEAVLAAEPRDLEARRVAVDAALAFARLEAEGASMLEWVQRAEALLAAAVCDDLALRSLAGRRQAVEALTQGR